ncbi:hypothetical protein R6Q57_025338 [Mikania cordata]
MDSVQDGGNVIHIISGNEADNQDDKPVESTWPDKGEGSGATASNLTYEGHKAVLSESFQVPAFGSSSLPVLENDISYKLQHCKRYYSESGCPFGDNCIYIHDDDANTWESSTIIMGPGFGDGYSTGEASGNGGQPAGSVPLAPLQARPLSAAAIETTMLPLAPVLVAQTVSYSTTKLLNWKTRICSRWERSGYCQYGSKCFFAHGDEELQQYRNGNVDKGANPNNQQLMVPNLAATYGSATTAHVVTASGSSVTHAGGSRKMSEAHPEVEIPKKINWIYGDWIDDE